MTPPTEDTQAPPFLGEEGRPDLVAAAKGKLSWLERLNLRIVRASLQPGRLNRMLQFFQRTLGQSWIHHGTKNLRQVVGLDRLPDLALTESVIVVANHRSFFDLYIITAELVRRGLKKRIVFLVRGDFFYDSLLGFLVNFFMSFLAMYPPVFRGGKKAFMNVLAVEELGWLLQRGGIFVGLHPEGSRKLDDDPYTYLPAQPGVGRIIQLAQVPVVPVFVSGLGNNVFKQLWANLGAQGERIVVVFGKPVEFEGVLDEPPSPRLHRQISERCLEEIAKLGQEERALKAKDRFGDPYEPRNAGY